MKTLILMIVVVLTVSACGDKEELAVCKGQPFALNTGHWQPTAADTAMPKARE